MLFIICYQFCEIFFSTDDFFFSIGNIEHHPEPELRRPRKIKHRSKLLVVGGVASTSGKSGKKKKRVENCMIYVFNTYFHQNLY